MSIHLRVHEEKNKPNVYFEQDKSQIRVLRASFLDDKLDEIYEIIRKEKASRRTTRLLLIEVNEYDEMKQKEKQTHGHKI